MAPLAFLLVLLVAPVLRLMGEALSGDNALALGVASDGLGGSAWLQPWLDPYLRWRLLWSALQAALAG